jgi:hypothetical protein
MNEIEGGLVSEAKFISWEREFPRRLFATLVALFAIGLFCQRQHRCQLFNDYFFWA